jgi:Cu2+-containing amine oxidase
METRHVGAAHMHTAQLGRRMDGLTNLIGVLRDCANAPQNTHKNSSQRVYHTHPEALDDSGKTQRIWKIWNRTRSNRNGWMSILLLLLPPQPPQFCLNFEFPLRLVRKYLKTE